MVHSLIADLAQHPRERLLLGWPQACGRLVQHDQHGIGGERTRDFQDALSAERQVAGEFIELVAEADALQLPLGLIQRPPLFGAVEAKRAFQKAGRGARHRRRAQTLSIRLMFGRSFTCWNVRAISHPRDRGLRTVRDVLAEKN